MARSLGKYQGVELFEGEDLAKRMREIDAQLARSSSRVAQTDPMQFGASGRGEFLEQNAPITKNATSKGVPMSEVGDYESNPNYRIPKSALPKPVRTLTPEEATGLARNYGVLDFGGYNEFAGLTRAQAEAKAAEKQKKLNATQSALTSYTFNREKIADVNKRFKDLKFKIDEVNNDPWSNKNEKRDKVQAILNSYNDQFASLFDSPQEFDAAMFGDQAFQQNMADYVRMGGDTNNITSKISQPASLNVVSYQDNPDGTTTNYLSDGSTDTVRLSQNPDGTYSSSSTQTLDEYLGAMSTPADQKAYESLIPERDVYQQQIAFEQSIPEKYKSLYFGSEEEVGLVQQKRKQMEEEIKLLERQAKLDEKNTRAQANFEIERNEKEMEMEAARIEENRLAAKNYMTGMLAKLGALNTTGAAPLALATLDQKYQKSTRELRTSYAMANKQISLKLNEAVDNIGLKRDENILKTKADLSKSEEEIWKEIFKLQNTADKETLNIVQRYAQEYRTQREKFTKEMESEAEKDLKERQRILEKYNPAAFLAQYGMTDQRPGKGKSNSGVNVAGGYDSWYKSYLKTPEGAALAAQYGNDNIRLSEELRKIYANVTKKKNVGNLTASNIPPVLKEAIVSAINRDVPLQELYTRFPNVSDSAVRSLYNSLKYNPSNKKPSDEDIKSVLEEEGL